ncbi:MAG: hypothetical protein AAF585_19155 [Verrucomicrobiota bacterium]
MNSFRIDIADKIRSLLLECREEVVQKFEKALVHWEIEDGWSNPEWWMFLLDDSIHGFGVAYYVGGISEQTRMVVLDEGWYQSPRNGQDLPQDEAFAWINAENRLIPQFLAECIHFADPIRECYLHYNWISPEWIDVRNGRWFSQPPESRHHESPEEMAKKHLNLFPLRIV